MKGHFIKYEQAVKLKKLGFDEECFMHYEDSEEQLHESFGTSYMKNSTLSKYETSAPLWQQAFDFFREKYDFFGKICEWHRDENERVYWYQISYTLKNSYDDNTTLYGTSSVAEDKHNMNYSEARQSCLEKLIEIAEIKKCQRNTIK